MFRSDKDKSRAAYILPTNLNYDGGFLDFDQWGCWVWSHSSVRKGESDLSRGPRLFPDATTSPHVLKSVTSRFKELQGKAVVL